MIVVQRVVIYLDLLHIIKLAGFNENRKILQFTT